ncbi:MAG: restriction endonuclease subunit S [Xanthomonadaceae bacterium]|nr:restriction endonuclease subunit S [Xanthomonadaceae bacterium]
MASEWREVPLVQVARISSGKRPSRALKDATSDCYVPIIGGGGPSGYTDSALFDGGVIITGRVGTLGKLFAPSGPCWPSDNALVIQPSSPETDFRFLRYALQHVIAEAAGMNRGAANPLITQGDLGRLPVSHPPLPEQRAIAHILGTLDDKIELNRKQNETLEAMARALFKAWFVDFEPVRAKMEGRWQRGQSLPGLPAHLYDLFPDRLVESELGEIPEGWCCSTIGEEVTVCGGSTPSTKEPAFWEGGQHCWATPKDLSSLRFPVLLDTERKITDAGLARISSGLLPAGTVLLSSRAPIGYLAITEVPTAINQGFIAMKCDGVLPNVFVLLWCRENMDAIVGNANGSTFLEISKSNFRPLRVVVPPDEVLTTFTKLAAPIYEDLAENEHESRTLAKLRDTLLPKLISGELRVKDAERFLEAAT